MRLGQLCWPATLRSVQGIFRDVHAAAKNDLILFAPLRRRELCETFMGEKDMKQKHILCFGDSLTWGFRPGLATRFDEDERWTGVLRRELGEEYCVHEDGISGRTSVFEDPYVPWRCGKAALGYTLMSQKPLDLVILMIGTNDLKFTDGYGAARGADCLVTGEAAHHIALLARQKGIGLVVAGHWGTEHAIADVLAVQLEKQFPALTVAHAEADADPYSYLL